MIELEGLTERVKQQIESGDASKNIKVPKNFRHWNPPFCGDMNLVIKANGDWIHDGGIINRKELVKLFSSIMRREDDGEYYLVTPVEKVRIQVEKAPFVVVDVEQVAQDGQQILICRTNVDDTIIIARDHPLVVTHDPETQEPFPTILVRDQLKALLSRSAFYRMVDIAEEYDVAGETCFGVWSSGDFFVLSSGI